MIPISVPGQRHTQVVPDNAAELGRWRNKVTELAKLAAGPDWPSRRRDPMHLTCRFLLPMPASRPAYVRKRGIGLCAVKPDLDKLLRAIGDGLTDAGVIFDDSHIVKGGQIKYEVANHRLCGAEVILRCLDADVELEAMLATLARRLAAPTLFAGRR